jgi:hypothetical protein
MPLITVRLSTSAYIFPLLGWPALSGQVFTDRISAARAVIIFSFVDLGSSIHMHATA